MIILIMQRVLNEIVPQLLFYVFEEEFVIFIGHNGLSQEEKFLVSIECKEEMHLEESPFPQFAQTPRAQG